MRLKSSRGAFAAVVVVLIGALLRPAVPGAQEPAAAVSGIGMEHITRLTGPIAVPTAAGGALPLNVEVRDWTLTGRGSSALPLQGFYLAHLLAGTVIADVGGTSEPHQSGDFWTVPQGAQMIVHIRPPSEVMSLQTIAVTSQGQ